MTLIYPFLIECFVILSNNTHAYWKRLSFIMTETEKGIIDFRLENDSSMLVSGPSKCGKTTFVIELLENRERLFRSPTRHVWWFYGVDSPEVHNKLRAMGVNLVEGSPQREHFDSIGEGDIVVLDDLQQESEGDKEITNLFLKGCHHKKFFVIKLTQYLFGGREQCIQNANVHYYVIFYNPRNQQQTITFLSRMFPPGNNGMLARILQDVHRNKYGYLFVDYTSNCDGPRLRTDIFGDFVVFKLHSRGHGKQMDYSRVALGTSVPGMAGGAGQQQQQATERMVQSFLSPQYGQMEHVARSLVTTPLIRTAREAKERTRRLANFNRLRMRYLGLTPAEEQGSFIRQPKTWTPQQPFTPRQSLGFSPRPPSTLSSCSPPVKKKMPKRLSKSYSPLTPPSLTSPISTRLRKKKGGFPPYN